MIHPPPPNFTPKHWESSIALMIILNWGFIEQPNCGYLDKNTILCSVNFPPNPKGEYKGWDVSLHWNGHKVVPKILVVPQV